MNAKIANLFILWIYAVTAAIIYQSHTFPSPLSQELVKRSDNLVKEIEKSSK